MALKTTEFRIKVELSSPRQDGNLAGMNPIECMLGWGREVRVQPPMFLKKGTELRHGTGTVQRRNKNRMGGIRR